MTKKNESADATAAEGAASTPALPDVSAMSYEEARDALVEAVAKLESGRADLESSVALWEYGEALAAHCTAALDRAEARLDARADASAGDERD